MAPSTTTSNSSCYRIPTVPQPLEQIHRTRPQHEHALRQQHTDLEMLQPAAAARSDMPVKEGQPGSEASKLQRTFRKQASACLVPEAPRQPSAIDRKEDPFGFSPNPTAALAINSSIRRSKSLAVQHNSEKYEIRQRTSPDRSSPTRRPKSTPHYCAPGSTRQLATFCEQERARFLSAKSAKPLKWTAPPVPRRFLELSVVFATVLSCLSRLWSALVPVLSCRKRTGPGKMGPVVTSVPRTFSPLAESGNCTPICKYPVCMEEFFTRASSAGPPQSDRSRSKRDTHSTMSKTPQHPRSRFEVSEQGFTRAVSTGPVSKQTRNRFEASEEVITRASSAGPLPSSTSSDELRNQNSTMDKNRRRPTIPSSRTAHKLIRRFSESILVRKTADASACTKSLGSFDLAPPRTPSALDNVVLDYLTDRLSSPSRPRSISALDEVVLDYLREKWVPS